MSEMVERAARKIAANLDSNRRPDTPYGYRRAMDKGSYEVYFLDYPEWRELIADVTIVARYAKEDEAEEHATRLQTEFLARAALLAALDLEDGAMRSAILGAMGFYGDGAGGFSHHAHDQARAAISALRAMVLTPEEGKEGKGHE